MLHLYMDKKSIRKYLVKDINDVFNKNQNDMWFYDKFNASLARNIDCVELLPPKKIANPVFGEVGVEFLSKYVKLFILLKEYPNAVYKISDVHPDFADILYDISKTVDVHLLYDSWYDFNEEQEACLPEYGAKIKGQVPLKTAFQTYLRNPAKLKSLLCFNIPKGEHLYV